MPMKFATRNNLLRLVKASVGSTLYRQLWVEEGSGKRDLLRSGRLGCAYFVAFLLHHLRLIQEPHVTVEGLLKDMEASGWKRALRPQPGAVVFWVPSGAHVKGEMHHHVGFLVDETHAISNSSRKGMPVKHHLTYGEKASKLYRPVEAYYWHAKLNG